VTVSLWFLAADRCKRATIAKRSNAKGFAAALVALSETPVASKATLAALTRPAAAWIVGA
jgi:hypothetical protein